MSHEGIRVVNKEEAAKIKKQLEDAEGKVEILLKRADGKIAAQPFGSGEDSS